jgi:hypothetical protein
MHAVVFFLVAWPGLAFSQPVHQSAEGARLEIGLPCAKDIAVVADPALSGRVVMDATAEHPEELAHMEFVGGDSVRLKLRGWFHMAGGSLLSLHGDCWRPHDQENFDPTLRIRLSVPSGFALAVDASGDGTYHLAAGGALTLDMSGSARVEATSLTRLDLSLSGSGDVKVAQVAGPVHADMSGSGDVEIAQVTAADMAVEQSGSSTFRVGGGTVGKLTVDSSGSGDVILHGTAGDTVVESSGSGQIEIARVTGRLVDDATGSGAVKIGK